jgi:hypothetical protein
MEEQPEIKPEALNKARVSNKLETLEEALLIHKAKCTQSTLDTNI